MPEPSRRQQGKLAGGAILGPLEFEIMEAVWDQGLTTIRQIVSALPQRPAYTTILSTASRLMEKGFLRRRDKRGRAVIYEPTCTKQEWHWSASREAAMRFLDTPHIPPEILIETLQSILAKRKSPDT